MQNNLDQVAATNIQKFEEFGEIINENSIKMNKARNQMSDV